MVLRKIAFAILTGLLYWILAYVILRLARLLDVMGLLSAISMFAILPTIIAILLLLFLKEQRYAGSLYCVIPVLVYAVVELVSDALFLPKNYDIIESTFLRFKLVGICSLLLSIIGGLIGVHINRRKAKRGIEE